MENIHLHDVFGYIQNLAIENTKLKEENSELKDNRMDAGRFYAAALNIEAVATLHNVHPDTVRKYVALGCIEKHPDSTDAKILIRASEALMLDFKELRKKGRYTGYSK